MSDGPRQRQLSALALSVATTDAILRELAGMTNRREVARLVEEIAHDFGFRHYALISHDGFSGNEPAQIDIKDYPDAIVEGLLREGAWRRDPVVRGCIFAEHAFLWSDLPALIKMNGRDRERLELGARWGLKEGITVPCVALGRSLGSCTFAGMKDTEHVVRFLGMAQIIGVFAFQAAKRISGMTSAPAPPVRLHPRPRDCVVLAGRGRTNKEIARALALAPRTVDGYLTEARRLFKAHDRTELVVSAVLAGEVGLHELRRQPE